MEWLTLIVVGWILHACWVQLVSLLVQRQRAAAQRKAETEILAQAKSLREREAEAQRRAEPAPPTPTFAETLDEVMGEVRIERVSDDRSQWTEEA